MSFSLFGNVYVLPKSDVIYVQSPHHLEMDGQGLQDIVGRASDALERRGHFENESDPRNAHPGRAQFEVSDGLAAGVAVHQQGLDSLVVDAVGPCHIDFLKE